MNNSLIHGGNCEFAIEVQKDLQYLMGNRLMTAGQL